MTDDEKWSKDYSLKIWDNWIKLVGSIIVAIGIYFGFTAQQRQLQGNQQQDLRKIFLTERLALYRKVIDTGYKMTSAGQTHDEWSKDLYRLFELHHEAVLIADVAVADGIKDYIESVADNTRQEDFLSERKEGEGGGTIIKIMTDYQKLLGLCRKATFKDFQDTQITAGELKIEGGKVPDLTPEQREEIGKLLQGLDKPEPPSKPK